MSVLSPILARIHNQASLEKRPAAQLMAVTKNQPMEKIKILLQEGHLLFGENRVQEAKQKWGVLKQEFPKAKVHLIGPLQTNKVKEALSLFDGIQTIDRPNLVEKIAQEWPKQGREISFFIQVNVGEEPQKSGVLRENFPALFKHCQRLKVPIVGLMALPPQVRNAAPYFKILKSLADQYQLPQISMGMSHDFETAISCGATLVRLGTALFGDRL